jgi:tRNA A-37 threonylcarbamoyl transferase component Bud32
VPSIQPLPEGFLLATDVALTPADFDPAHWAARGALRKTALGRGLVYFVAPEAERLAPSSYQNGQAEPRLWVLRHYRRGGVIGRWVARTYWFTGVKRTRAYRELALLEALSERQLPVPRPVGAWVSPVAALGYQASLLMGAIDGAQDLFSRLLAAALAEQEWHAIGGLIARFHREGVYHADLNCHNLIQDAAASWWMIDFDRALLLRPALRAPWQAANLDRLLRSLRKEQHKAQVQGRAFHWRFERDWPLLVTAYETAWQTNTAPPLA